MRFYAQLGRVAPSPPKDDSSDDKDWPSIIDKSSQQNRNALLLFVSTCVFLLITIAGVKDKSYILPNSDVTLPVINIGIPVGLFFFAGPILLIILHLDILYNLREHRKKLAHWHDGSDHILWPFIYNNAVMRSVFSFSGFVSNLLMFLAVFVLPLLVMFYFANRYFPAHAFVPENEFLKPGMLFSHLFTIRATSEQHVAFVAIDLMIAVFYFGIFKRLDTEKYSYLELDRKHPYLNIRNEVVVNVVRIYSAIICVVMFLLYAYCPLHYLMTDERGKRTEYLSLDLDVKETSFIVKEPPSEVIQLYVERELAKLEKKEKDVTEEERAKAAEQAKMQAFLDFGEGVDLREKDLRHANFFKCDLTRARFDKAVLDKADLSFVKLKGSDISTEQLKVVASLRGAELQGWDFASANLEGINLMETNLQGADFSWASLQGADFGRAELQDADLFGANLQGADLSWANLQGANLRWAYLQGVNLYKANLQGADLYLANLQGADLSEAYLQGADLSEAN
ncbi:MAG: pentapeptide repeat-containing protein, partial [Nitrospinota bacterium]|nr:pentapeptide repeat-containing protein [Nitrospinota bacterium]